MIVHVAHGRTHQLDTDALSGIARRDVVVHGIEFDSVVPDSQDDGIIFLRNQADIDCRLLGLREAVPGDIAGHFLHSQRQQVAAPWVDAVFAAPIRNFLGAPGGIARLFPTLEDGRSLPIALESVGQVEHLIDQACMPGVESPVFPRG